MRARILKSDYLHKSAFLHLHWSAKTSSINYIRLLGNVKELKMLLKTTIEILLNSKEITLHLQKTVARFTIGKLPLTRI